MPVYKIGNLFYSVSSSSLEVSDEEYTFVRLIPVRAIVHIEYLYDISITLTLSTKETFRILKHMERDAKPMEKLFGQLRRNLT
jgi:hypothetical protein